MGVFNGSGIAGDGGARVSLPHKTDKQSSPAINESTPSEEEKKR